MDYMDLAVPRKAIKFNHSLASSAFLLLSVMNIIVTKQF